MFLTEWYIFLSDCLIYSSETTGLEFPLRVQQGAVESLQSAAFRLRLGQTKKNDQLIDPDTRQNRAELHGTNLCLSVCSVKLTFRARRTEHVSVVPFTIETRPGSVFRE